MEKQHLDSIRHSCAHLLAAAVKSIWPQAKNAIGPSIEEGFYQDFDMGEVRLSEADLPKIEKRMRQLLKTWKPFIVNEVSVVQAKKDFADNPYKLELIDELAKFGKTITENNPGNFLDLCKGGHAAEPQKEMQNFKLLSIAGAYWRGDEKNKMLTRIYGTCFEAAQELTDYLKMLEEAKKRDHRKLGEQLDLFTFSDLVGPGLPMFTPKGTILRDQLEGYINELNKEFGYKKVWIPHLTKPELYKVSGHWDKFADNLFHVKGANDAFVVKPMNCPHHTQIYASSPRSYKDLPLRFHETTTVYRDEKSGQLGGLTRVRCITQDDGHDFLRPDQIEEEIDTLLTMQWRVLKSVGLTDYWISLSLRDPKNKKAYLGDDAVWEVAQRTMENILKRKKITYKAIEGEAAFYGPKMDLMVKDSIGRLWQLSTIQLDFNQPKRFGLEYTDAQGVKQTPVMIHRAFMGSTERFLGVLIEHFAGAFPVWLAPVQVYIASVGKAHGTAVRKLGKMFTEEGMRVEVDDGDETVGYKVRKAEKQKIPYVLVVGDKEKALKKLTVRVRGQEKQPTMSVNAFIKKVQTEIEKKR
ncbi:threonine--tRNA ligase [Candidatus Uhrbacteria bacterium]|nr:threonine--tRNA ligase [Candidatus Uhrbacteria bacterium]